jgi:Type II CAAX prenyl endopeptidase Rce1-like
MNDAVMNQRADRVLFVLVLLAGWFGVLVGLPWALAVLRDYPNTGWWWEAAGDLLFFIPASAAVGVWLGKKVSLGSGLRELVSGTPGCWKQVRWTLVPGTLVGLTLGALGLISQNVIPKDALIPALNNPNTFEWLLRCLSAALTEEIAFRFGLMSFFVWIIWAVVKRPAIHAPSLWIGNLLSALVFAAAHFPQLELQRYGLSLLIPFIVSSSGTGMIMGWLYMRYGLVSAIAAHLVTDLMIYVIPRLVAVIA